MKEDSRLSHEEAKSKEIFPQFAKIIDFASSRPDIIHNHDRRPFL